MVELILESGSLAEMLQNVENVQALHTYDRKELKKYVAIKEEIAELKVTLETEQKELQKLQANLESQKAALDKKIKDKKNQIANLDAQIAEAARKAAEEARKKAEAEAAKNQVVINSNVGKGDQSVGNAIVAAARSYIGVWYLWGGNDRNGIDCSGLTKACHKAVGITIDRWSGHQAIGGKAIGDGKEDLDKALPGDIICYPGHVAIYIGNYRVIHAPCTGKKVQEASVYLGGKQITAIRRYW
jgi:cell wall-associated NlpC family hydrolase